MIEKILDKYYIKKLKNEIKELLQMYFIDYKFVDEKDVIRIFIKKNYYADTEYELIGNLDKNRGITYLSHIEKINEELTKEIDKYFENHK